MPSLKTKFICEFFGTFAIVFAGCGALMVAERFPGSMGSGMVAIIFGLVVIAVVYSIGPISGAHANPAVTLGFALGRHFPWNQTALYWCAQFSGGLFAIALLHFILPSGHTYGATTPQVDAFAAVAWETILTFLLMFIILGVSTGTKESGIMAGIAVGATVTVDALVGGAVTGASMNPARSLAPAIFEGQIGTLWIYFLGPCLGAVFATWLFSWMRRTKDAPSPVSHFADSFTFQN